jgi:hypothetical protein
MRERGADAAAFEVYHHVPDLSGFDLVVAPVHLPPGNPAHQVAIRLGKRPITHHQAVGYLLAGTGDFRAFEVTGTRGKTTTALILAQVPLCQGNGRIPHHRGIEVWRDGKREVVTSGLSIAPANVIRAWEAAEEGRRNQSGIRGLPGRDGPADFGILTSFAEDYRIAGETLWASTAKLQMVSLAKPGFELIAGEDVRISADFTFGPGPRGQVWSTERKILAGGETARLRLGDGLDLRSYAPAIAGATAAALAAGLDLEEIASALEGFEGLGGRMKVVREGGILFVDNPTRASGRRSGGGPRQRRWRRTARPRRRGGGGDGLRGDGRPALINLLVRRRREVDLLILVGERRAPYASGRSAETAPDLEAGLAGAKAALERGDRLVSCVKCFR